MTFLLGNSMSSSTRSSQGYARAVYCPVCACERDQPLAHQVHCPNWGGFTPQLQGSLRAAVYGVDPPKAKPREPELAAWLWCPNCTQELDEYDEAGKFLRCSQCGLHLRSVSLMELVQAKADHPTLEADGW